MILRVIRYHVINGLDFPYFTEFAPQTSIISNSCSSSSSSSQLSTSNAHVTMSCQSGDHAKLPVSADAEGHADMLWILYNTTQHYSQRLASPGRPCLVGVVYIVVVVGEIHRHQRLCCMCVQCSQQIRHVVTITRRRQYSSNDTSRAWMIHHQPVYDRPRCD